MDAYLNEEQKELIKQYIENAQIKAVELFDYVQKKVRYSSLIKTSEQINVLNGDEEIVRAYLITKLVNELGYSMEKIELEREYTAGRPHTNTSYCDLIVHDISNNDFLFFELKSPHDYHCLPFDQHIEEQLFKVSGMAKQEGTTVKYLVYYTIDIIGNLLKDECIIIDNERYEIFSDWKDERNFTDELPSSYGISKKTAYIKGSTKDLETNFTPSLLNKLQEDLHNVLWGGGSTDDNEVFASLTNLILTKIEDEDITEDGNEYGFQCLVYDDNGSEVYESSEILFERINGIYRKALQDRLNITDQNVIDKSYVIDTNKFSLNKLRYTVQQLEKYSFVDGKNSVSGKDILGDFFEAIVRTGFKQSKGQFFTPINVVKFMLWAVQADKLALHRINNHQEIPYLIDSSAGSGSFLIEYMKFITENINHRFKDKVSSKRAVQNKMIEWFPTPNRENSWAQTFVYGSELNFNLGTAVKVNMILHGDGSANIFVGGQKGDGLLPFSMYKKNGGVNELDKESNSDVYEKKVNEHFDLILTNPPFSVELDNETQRSLQDNYIFSENECSENLFIERYYQLLKPNGRMAIVLPESIFDTTDNRYIRLFLYKYFKIKAIVSLPQITFQPYTSTKTSILFAQKKTNDEIKSYDNEWKQLASSYSALALQVKNIIEVVIENKNPSRIKCLSGLNQDDYKNIIIKFLLDKFEECDLNLSINEIVNKYIVDLEKFLKLDSDSVNQYGNVNIGWIFRQISKKINYEIRMCEAELIGYKRTTRGPKETPNELYRQDEKGNILVDDGIEETILDYLRHVEWDY